VRNDFHTVVSERGLSLVELLVAMAIGLIGSIIIFQVFNASEGVRRTTSAGGDAQQTGAIALYALEHDIRQAGMGFSDPTFVGCTVNAYDNKPGPRTYSFPLVPVSITAGGTTKDADTIAVLYGSKQIVVNGVALSKDYSSPNMSAPVNISNPWQFQAGDLIILRAGAPNTANPCFLFEVTTVAPNNDINHAPGGARFNPPGGFSGTGLVYPLSSVVYNLGNYLPGNAIPVFNTYSLSGNTLQYVSGFSDAPTTAVQVADNIVHMHARYVLNNGTFVVPPAVPAWANLAAVNIAVVARSRLPEKPSGGSTTCNTTSALPPPAGNLPTWSGGNFDLSADPNWQCYRYRVFETTVPIRNWIWHN